MKRIVANRMRKGTSRANVGEGVAINNHAPTAPPITLMLPNLNRKAELFFSSLRYPKRPPNSPGHSATVLVALATLASNPSQRSAGKVINVPPPAIELMPPAMNAAAKRVRKWKKVVFILLNQVRHSSRETRCGLCTQAQ